MSQIEEAEVATLTEEAAPEAPPPAWRWGQWNPGQDQFNTDFGPLRLQRMGKEVRVNVILHGPRQSGEPTEDRDPLPALVTAARPLVEQLPEVATYRANRKALAAARTALAEAQREHDQAAAEAQSTDPGAGLLASFKMQTATAAILATVQARVSQLEGEDRRLRADCQKALERVRRQAIQNVLAEQLYPERDRRSAELVARLGAVLDELLPGLVGVQTELQRFLRGGLGLADRLEALLDGDS